MRRATFAHLPAVIASTRKRVYGMRGPIGMGYTPVSPGNKVVDPTTADAACTGNFVTPGTWPPSMTQEAVAVLRQGAGTQFIYCGDDKKLYQVNANGTLMVCNGLDPQFDPAAPPPPQGTQCPPGQVYDPSTGQCTGGGQPDQPPTPVNLPGGTPPTSITATSTTISTPLLIVGGVVLVAGAAALAWYATSHAHSAHPGQRYSKLARHAA